MRKERVTSTNADAVNLLDHLIGAGEEEQPVHPIRKCFTSSGSVLAGGRTVDLISGQAAEQPFGHQIQVLCCRGMRPSRAAKKPPGPLYGPLAWPLDDRDPTR